MPKPYMPDGVKNLVARQLISLRKQNHLSQRDLARKMQSAGYAVDKNVITRIESNKRYVTDIELKAFCEIFQVTYEYLITGKAK